MMGECIDVLPSELLSPAQELEKTGAGGTGLRSLRMYDEHIPFFSSEDPVQG